MKSQSLLVFSLISSLLLPRAALCQKPAAVTLSAHSLDFNSQSVGTVSASQAITLTNSGGTALNISSISADPSVFTIVAAPTTTCSVGTAVAAGNQCVVNVTFTPAAVKSYYGALTIKDDDGGTAGSTQTVSLFGTGVAPSAVPAPTPGATLSYSNLAFAPLAIGGSSPQTVTLTNSGGANLIITSIQSDPATDFGESDDCKSPLAPAANCTITVTFKPTAIGARAGKITIKDNASGNPHIVSLSGTGAGGTLSVLNLSFGTVSVGDISSALPLTITNNGSATLNIAKQIEITGANPGDFAISGNKCGPNLSTNTNCEVDVTFAPKTTGKRNAQLVITYNTINGPQQTIALVGIGGGLQRFYYELLGGLDLTATSTVGPEQQYFADTSLLRSVGCHVEKDSAAAKSRDKLGYDRCWVWFTGKIASVPTAQTAALSSLANYGTSIPGLNQKTLGDITQSLEIHAGFEAVIKKAFNKRPAFISFIIGGGAVSPFNNSTGSPEFDLAGASGSGAGYLAQQFMNNSYFDTQYPILSKALGCSLASGSTQYNCTGPASGLKEVAFVLPNRSRFYREYSAGFRIRGFLSDLKTYPITFDVKFGQDETVTAGKLWGLVTTISGDSPIPGAPWLRVFGSAYLRWHKNLNSPTLVLLPTQSPVALSDPSVVLQPSQQADQDYFRLGFGVDITKIIQAATKSSSGSSGASGKGTT